MQRIKSDKYIPQDGAAFKVIKVCNNNTDTVIS